jgi:hypothetical protein
MPGCFRLNQVMPGCFRLCQFRSDCVRLFRLFQVISAYAMIAQVRFVRPE